MERHLTLTICLFKGDMFLRIPEDQVYTPYIAHNQEGEDGFVLVHGHPLNGTKFFTWGESGPGRFMQDFLAGGGKGEGYYTELQVGPAPTQMQNFAVPKGSITEWTEWFKGFWADDSKMRGTDYQAALDNIDELMKKTDGTGMPQELVKDIDSFFQSHATDTPTEILVRGQPWGALEELLLGAPLAPGLTFTLPVEGEEGYAEMKPWMELVQDGTFSADTLSKMPLSYQTTDRWLALLQKSADTYGMTWLHALHLGIASAERGNIAEPKQLFELSWSLKQNPVAARNLAVLSTTAEEAWPYWEGAWSILHSNFKGDTGAYHRLTLNLMTEISFFLQQEGWFPEMEAFALNVISNGYIAEYEPDAFITMNIKQLMNKGNYEEARSILGKNCFPTYAKARDDLMDMWNTCSEGIAQQQKGDSNPLTAVEKHQVRVQNRIPDNIGCQYASEYCTNYW